MSRVELAGDLSIYQVGELKPMLLRALDESHRDQQPIELAMGAVSECDGAGLQLLLALAKSAAEFGIAVHLCNPPPAISDLLQTYGLSNRFVAVAGD